MIGYSSSDNSPFYTCSSDNHNCSHKNELIYYCWEKCSADSVVNAPRSPCPHMKLWHVTTNLGRQSLLLSNTQPNLSYSLSFHMVAMYPLAIELAWCGQWNFRMSSRTISYYLWTDLSWEKNLPLSAFCEQLGLVRSMHCPMSSYPVSMCYVLNQRGVSWLVPCQEGYLQTK